VNISTYDADETMADEETFDADIRPGLPECGRVMYACYKVKNVFIASLHFHKSVFFASLHFLPPRGQVF